MGSRIVLRAMMGALALGGLTAWTGAAGAQGFQQPQQIPENCQALLAAKQEVDKRGEALQKAGQAKAPVAQLCTMFRGYVSAEAKLIKAVEKDAVWCGVPPQFSQQLKAGHPQAVNLRNQACAAAAQANRPPPGPSLSDALGAPTSVPDASAANTGYGTFDTLTGNALTR